MFVPAALAHLSCMAAIAGDESTAAAAVGEAWAELGERRQAIFRPGRRASQSCRQIQLKIMKPCIGIRCQASSCACATHYFQADPVEAAHIATRSACLDR
jgi:hypothetical protein